MSTCPPDRRNDDHSPTLTAGRGEYLRYKRSRFTARLPLDRLYTRSHYWVQDRGAGTWRVGFTRFAKRMLGDIVEMGFEVEVGAAVEKGQLIGWVEAFKAVADVYCVTSGRLTGTNPALAGGPAAIDEDPDGEGWLYEVSGPAAEDWVDANGYAGVLDERIDIMLGERDAQHDSREG